MMRKVSSKLNLKSNAAAISDKKVPVTGDLVTIVARSLITTAATGMTWSLTTFFSDL